MPPHVHQTETSEKECASPTTAAAVPGLRLCVTTREDPQFELVREAHRRLLAPTFCSHELEDVEMWCDMLQHQSDMGPLKRGAHNRYEFCVATVVRDCREPCSGGLSDDNSDSSRDEIVVLPPPTVLGVAVFEVYFAPRVTLVSYIVVDEQLRGGGVAKDLLGAVEQSSRRLLESVHEGEGRLFHGMVIEVLQDRDDEKGRAGLSFPSSKRHKIFTKLGFVPLDFDYVHPGKMKGGRYNIAVCDRGAGEPGHCAGGNAVVAVGLTPTAPTFSSPVLLSFVRNLIAGILCQEDDFKEEDVDAEMQQWTAALGDKSEVPMGLQYWR